MAREIEATLRTYLLTDRAWSQEGASRAEGMPVTGYRDTLTTGELGCCVLPADRDHWADDGDIPCWRTSGGHRRFSAADLRASGYVPVEKSRLDPTVEAWAMTLEQVMSAAADHFSANGDVRRARMIRQVRGRLVRRLRRG